MAASTSGATNVGQAFEGYRYREEYPPKPLKLQPNCSAGQINRLAELPRTREAQAATQAFWEKRMNVMPTEPVDEPKLRRSDRLKAKESSAQKVNTLLHHFPVVKAGKVQVSKK